MKIKAIIFDLGGVILNIDYPKMVEAFTILGAEDFDAMHQVNLPLFEAFSKGEITKGEFHQQVCAKLKLKLDETQFDTAINAMLLDLPYPRLAYIQQLKNIGYQTFLLSNTNAIHYEKLKLLLREQYGLDSLRSYFDKEYYSHLTGVYKPAVAAYQMVLAEARLLPEQVVFIDDDLNNVKAAATLGIEAKQLVGELTSLTMLDLR